MSAQGSISEARWLGWPMVGAVLSSLVATLVVTRLLDALGADWLVRGVANGVVIAVCYRAWRVFGSEPWVKYAGRVALIALLAYLAGMAWEYYERDRRAGAAVERPAEARALMKA